MDLKKIKKDLKIYEGIDFKFYNNGILYSDIGYGDKFVILYLNLEDKSLSTLRDFSSYQVFKEILKRFITISYPAGFRTRFILSLKQDIYTFKKYIDEVVGNEKVLDLFILDSVGVGNEKIMANNLSSNKIMKVREIIENFGLCTDLIIDKELILDNFNADSFIVKSFPNCFLKKLDNSFYNEKLRDRTVFMITTILKKLY